MLNRVVVTMIVSKPIATNPHLPNRELAFRCRVTRSFHAIGFPVTCFGLCTEVVRLRSKERVIERSPNFLTCNDAQTMIAMLRVMVNQHHAATGFVCANPKIHGKVLVSGTTYIVDDSNDSRTRSGLKGVNKVVHVPEEPEDTGTRMA